MTFYAAETKKQTIGIVEWSKDLLHAGQDSFTIVKAVSLSWDGRCFTPFPRFSDLHLGYKFCDCEIFLRSSQDSFTIVKAANLSWGCGAE